MKCAITVFLLFIHSCSSNAFSLIRKYATIGYPLETPDQSEEVVFKTIQQFWTACAKDTSTVWIPVEEGNDAGSLPTFLYRGTMSGAELWCAVTSDRNVLGFEPHFCGDSRLQVQVTARNKDESGLEAWLNANVDGFPIEFSCPNYGLHKELLKADSSVVNVQLAAFPDDISIFDSIEAYDKEQENLPNAFDLWSGTAKGKKKGLAMMSQSFTLASVFDKTKKCEAMFTGHVIKTNKRVNEVTGEPFYWALVRTMSNVDVDVVIDPRLLEYLNQCPPQVGGVIQGYFWLSGRIMVKECKQEYK